MTAAIGLDIIPESFLIKNVLSTRMEFENKLLGLVFEVIGAYCAGLIFTFDFKRLHRFLICFNSPFYTICSSNNRRGKSQCRVVQKHGLLPLLQRFYGTPTSRHSLGPISIWYCNFGLT